MSNTTKVILCLIAACIVFSLLNRKSESSPDGMFEDTWQSAIDNQHFTKISKLMIDNNISGCGEMYIKESTENENEFLIACSSDGNSFTYYLTWPNTDKIMSVKDEGFKKPNE